MSATATKTRQTPSRQRYDEAFERECAVEYPNVDAVVSASGFAMRRPVIQEMARTLACPVKVNPPNWQHGRLIFSLYCRYLLDTFEVREKDEIVRCVDIGTAKGFSALCAAAALRATSTEGRVHSCDVIDPKSRTLRNGARDCDGPTTIAELVAPWPELASRCEFSCQTGAALIRSLSRAHLAFVDGKHSHAAVSEELGLLADRQKSGDLVIADDVQVDGVRQAVDEAKKSYETYDVFALENRRYAVLCRR